MGVYRVMLVSAFKDFFDYFLGDLTGKYTLYYHDIDLYYLFIVLFSLVAIYFLIIKPFYSLIKRFIGGGKK